MDEHGSDEYQSIDTGLPALILGRLDVARQLLAAIPEFGEFLDAVPPSLQVFSAAIHKAETMPAGLRGLHTQAVNELFDLLAGAVTGEGRGTMKATRSLFELAVTASDISTSSEELARYEAHKDVVFHQWAVQNSEGKHLSGKERRAYEHHTRVAIRETRVAHDAAVDQYGSAFRRRWSPRDLEQRARSHGLTNDYALYRLSSAIMHGSSGGLAGLSAEMECHVVHRIGPALSLAPLALINGLNYFEITVRVMADRTDVVGAEDVYETLRWGRKLWPDYSRYMTGLDADWWHHAPRQDVVAVLVILPYGSEQWYLNDLQQGTIRRAHKPVLTGAQRESFNDFVSWVRKTVSDGQLFAQPVSLAAEGVRVEPVETAPWMPAGRMLSQEPIGGWQGAVTPDKPHTIDPDITG